MCLFEFGGISKYNLATTSFTALSIPIPSLTSGGGFTYLTSEFNELELATNGQMYFVGTDFWANSTNVYDFDPIQ